jgi:uncharacterized protein (TIGR00297 family)
MNAVVNIIGVMVSFVYVFAVIGVAGFLKKRLRLSSETSRKMIHILLCNWIFTVYIFDNVWFAVFTPACFVVINFVSHRKNMITAMEREVNDTYGTVFYAVTLLAAVIFGFYVSMAAAVCGVLAMGYGDGFGAAAGNRWGKIKFPEPFAKKSVAGSAAVLGFVFVCVFGVMLFYETVETALAVAAVCAVFAAVVELCSPRGTDNLTLPLVVAATVFVMTAYPENIAVFLNAAISAAVLLAAWARGGLTVFAVISAFVIGTLLFIFGGWGLYAALLAFFVLGSVISRVGKEKKREAEQLHARTGKRSCVQVLANALPPLLFCVIGHFLKDETYIIASFACLAAAAADTAASEIGMLASKPPIGIITFKPVQKGLSGGVSAAGFGAAVVGSLCVAGVAALFAVCSFILIFICGVFGSVADSVLGAAVQAKYLAENGYTENPPHKGAKPAKGFRFINNDAVNFISIMLAGGLCLLVINGW